MHQQTCKMLNGMKDICVTQMLERKVLKQESHKHTHNSIVMTTARSGFGYNDNVFLMVRRSGLKLSKLFLIVKINSIFDDTFLYFSKRQKP